MKVWMQRCWPKCRVKLSQWLWSAMLVLSCMVAGPASAKAPAGRYTIATASVFDTVTKLTWQRAHFDGTKNWADAKTYCSALALDKGGWHLPTVKELLTIVDLSVFNPAIDSVAFPNTPNEYFWSATPYAPSSGYAWMVNFLNGYAGDGHVSSTRRVRCVR